MSDNREVIITRHSIERTKDRLGLSKKLAKKNAQKAFYQGLTHAETKNGLKRYINKLFLSYDNGNNIRVFHRHVYIFQGRTLITIINLPKKFHALADKLQEQKERRLNERSENSNWCSFQYR